MNGPGLSKSAVPPIPPVTWDEILEQAAIVILDEHDPMALAKSGDQLVRSILLFQRQLVGSGVPL